MQIGEGRRVIWLAVPSTHGERIFINLLRGGICLLLFFISLDQGGYHYRPASLFTICTCIFMCLWLLLPGRKKPSMTAMVYALAAFLVLTFLSTLFSVYLHDSLIEWSSFACFFMLFVLAFDLFGDPGSYRFFVHILVALGFVICVIGLVIYLVVGKQEDLVSTFMQRNALGGVLLVLFPAPFALFLASRELRAALLYGFVTAVIGLSMLLSFSRGTYLSFLCMMSFLALLVVARKAPCFDVRRTVTRCLIMAVIICSLFLSFKVLMRGKFQAQVTERLRQRTTILFSRDDEDRDARVKFWHAALAISLHHPLLGTGMKTFERFYPPYQTDFRLFTRYTHSLYLQLLTEVGWPALCAFLGILFFFIKDYLRGLQAMDSSDVDQAACCAAGMSLIGSMAHQVVDFDWLYVAIPALLMATLGAASGRMQRHEEVPGAPSEVSEGRHSMKPGIRIPQVVGIPFLIVLALFSALPLVSQPHADKGAWWAKNDNTAKAIEEYAAAASLDPCNSIYCRELASQYLRHSWTGSRESLELALRYAQSSVRLDPCNALNHYVLGSVFLRKGEPDKALVHLCRALTLDPRNHPLFYNDLGFLYFQQGDYEKAEQYYRTAMELFPPEPAKSSNEIKPGLSLVYLGMGNISAEAKKNYGEARSYFIKSLDLDSSNVSACFALGYSFYMDHAYGSAIRCFDKARIMAPGYALTYFYTGLSYKGLKKDKEAQPFLDKAFQLDPSLRGHKEAAQ
jgi:tetratricopeptide (TPR) repeat protein/O-antigen ligase